MEKKKEYKFSVEVIEHPTGKTLETITVGCEVYGPSKRVRNTIDAEYLLLDRLQQMDYRGLDHDFIFTPIEM